MVARKAGSGSGSIVTVAIDGVVSKSPVLVVRYGFPGAQILRAIGCVIGTFPVEFSGAHLTWQRPSKE